MSQIWKLKNEAKNEANTRQTPSFVVHRLTSRRTENVKKIMKLNLNIMNIQGANVVHGQRFSHSILAPIFGRLRNPFLRVGRVLHFDRRAHDGLDDHSSPIGTDEDGVDDHSSPIGTDEKCPAPFPLFVIWICMHPNAQFLLTITRRFIIMGRMLSRTKIGTKGKYILA